LAGKKKKSKGRKLKSPIKDLSEYEVLLRPLLIAAIAKGWHEALDPVFMGKAGISILPELDIYGILACNGDPESIEPALSSIRAQGEISKKEMEKRALPLVLSFTRKLLKEGDSLPADETEITSRIMRSLKKSADSASVIRTIKTVIGEQIPAIDALIVSSLISWLLTINRRQELLFRGRHSLVARKLYSLGVVEPILATACCPNCTAFEFRLSRKPRHRDLCPSCGSRWAELILYLFRPEYITLKRKNNDLPVLLSAWLRHSSEEMITVMPCAEYTMDNKQFEIDVVIRDTATAIECKTFEDPIIVSSSKAKSIAGKLIKQIEIQRKLGFKRHAVVVSAGIRESQAIEKAIREKSTVIGLDGSDPDELNVIPAEFPHVSNFVSHESRLADKVANEKIRKEFQQANKKTSKKKTRDRKRRGG
jgi:hypothetical protein